MKKLLLTLAILFLLMAPVIASKPTGERQGDSPNTGVFGQCGNDKQCDDGLFCNGAEWCDKSTSPGHCEAGEPECDGGICDEKTDTCNDVCQPTDEICDGIDNDCDSEVDEGNPGGDADCDTGVPGICAAGTTNCEDGAIVCNQDQQPIEEVCDGLDNDCDGTVDNGNPGGNVVCDTGTPGICAAGTTNCEDGAIVCNKDQQPSVEVCDDELDNDCDGATDADDSDCDSQCTPEWGYCDSDDECCDGLGCTYDTMYDDYVCGGCIDPGYDCDYMGSACCAQYGSVCEGGKCVEGTCTPEWGDCDSDDECCNGLACTYDTSYGDYVCGGCIDPGYDCDYMGSACCTWYSGCEDDVCVE
jgi:hypothetical protein